jgi:inorganic phosphate transporter, PiT family
MFVLQPMMVALIIMVFLFDFLNGVNDSSNIVATMISSRAMAPRKALLMSAAAIFLSPFIFGVAVANTIGSEIVSTTNLHINSILAALLSAIIWNRFTWFIGLPSSASHALIGGLIGAVVAGAGFGSIKLAGLEKVLIAMFTSPLIGLLVGFLVLRLVYFLARGATPRINWYFKRAQVLTSLALALSYGANDAQKTMGIVTLGLVVTGNLAEFKVPIWVITLSAGAIALGTSIGGWRLIRTLGAKFYKIQPVHAFSSQASSATIILGLSFFGLPTSTTQVVSTSIMGVGAAERINKVRWGVAGEIAIAWVITIPANALLAYGLYFLLFRIAPPLGTMLSCALNGC